MDLEGLKTGAQAASENVAKFQEDIPGLLSGLKTNLTSIFAKDNPMMAQRENALTTYLNTPSQTRAALLPGNLPMVEGSNLNLSPTQQNAIVTARSNAALVPLAGLNQSIVGQYGNIGDILAAAAQTYQSQLQAAQTRATSAFDLYKQAVAEDQFNRELARKQTESGYGNDILSLLFGGNQPLGGDQRLPIESFEQSDQINPLQISANPTEVSPGFTGSQPLTVNPNDQGLLGNAWDWLTGLIGATPRQQQEIPPGPLSGYNFNNLQIPGIRTNY